MHQTTNNVVQNLNIFDLVLETYQFVMGIARLPNLKIQSLKIAAH